MRILSAITTALMPQVSRAAYRQSALCGHQLPGREWESRSEVQSRGHARRQLGRYRATRPVIWNSTNRRPLA